MKLTEYTDDYGQVWRICTICFEWTKFEDLVLDPEDGLRWDVCTRDKCKEKAKL